MTQKSDKESVFVSLDVEKLIEDSSFTYILKKGSAFIYVTKKFLRNNRSANFRGKVKVILDCGHKMLVISTENAIIKMQLLSKSITKEVKSLLWSQIIVGAFLEIPLNPITKEKSATLKILCFYNQNINEPSRSSILV